MAFTGDWLINIAKVSCSRPLDKLRFQGLVANASNCELLQAANCELLRHETGWMIGQAHLLQRLVEAPAKCDLPQAAWQRNILEALVEVTAECDHLQAARERHIHEALVEVSPECDRLQFVR